MLFLLAVFAVFSTIIQPVPSRSFLFFLPLLVIIISSLYFRALLVRCSLIVGRWYFACFLSVVLFLFFPRSTTYYFKKPPSLFFVVLTFLCVKFVSNAVHWPHKLRSKKRGFQQSDILRIGLHERTDGSTMAIFSFNIRELKVVLWSKNNFLFFLWFWKRVRLTPNWQNFELWVLSKGCLFWV